MYVNLPKLFEVEEFQLIEEIETIVREEEEEFINNFFKISVLFDWQWHNAIIDKESIIDRITSFVHTLIVNEFEIFSEHKEWMHPSDLRIDFSSSGRITVSKGDFDEVTNELQLELLSSL